MGKTIGCLHAHHSNIGHIDRTLAGLGAELLHYVDPGLVRRVSREPSFRQEDGRRRVQDQVDWIGQSGADAILVTCTQYMAELRDNPASLSVPVVGIDEPFFESVCGFEGPQLLLFTNRATVGGTMERLQAHAFAIGRQPNVEVRVLDGLFELVMRGEQERHDLELFQRIREQATSDPGRRLAVAQLSMTAAADRAGSELGIPIGHALESLTSRMKETLRR
ncbi:hypothetical protein [Cohnella sp.]|uniref:hypothetical protein n=1 Tax=Cohnella sp. TaxID=1883426 RepID=UPI00370472EF